MKFSRRPQLTRTLSGTILPWLSTTVTTVGLTQKDLSADSFQLTCQGTRRGFGMDSQPRSEEGEGEELCWRRKQFLFAIFVQVKSEWTYEPSGMQPNGFLAASQKLGCEVEQRAGLFAEWRQLWGRAGSPQEVLIRGRQVQPSSWAGSTHNIQPRYRTIATLISSTYREGIKCIKCNLASLKTCSCFSKMQLLINGFFAN